MNKSLCQFSKTLDVKPKTDVCRLCASKSNHKISIPGSMLWSIITKRRSYKNINECVKRSLCNWIIRHPQVVQSPIYNYCIKISIYGQAEPQLFPRFLLKLLFIELHNIMVSPPEEVNLRSQEKQNITQS